MHYNQTSVLWFQTLHMISNDYLVYFLNKFGLQFEIEHKAKSILEHMSNNKWLVARVTLINFKLYSNNKWLYIVRREPYILENGAFTTLGSINLEKCYAINQSYAILSMESLAKHLNCWKLKCCFWNDKRVGKTIAAKIHYNVKQIKSIRNGVFCFFQHSGKKLWLQLLS